MTDAALQAYEIGKLKGELEVAVKERDQWRSLWAGERNRAEKSEAAADVLDQLRLELGSKWSAVEERATEMVQVIDDLRAALRSAMDRAEAAETQADAAGARADTAEHELSFLRHEELGELLDVIDQGVDEPLRTLLAVHAKLSALLERS